MAAMFQVCKEVERKRTQRMGVVRPFFPPQVARWQVAPSVNYHQCLIPVFELYSARSLFTTRLHGVKRARQIRQVGKYEKMLCSQNADCKHSKRIDNHAAGRSLGA